MAYVGIFIAGLGLGAFCGSRLKAVVMDELLKGRELIAELQAKVAVYEKKV
jgi:hypothetical protein